MQIQKSLVLHRIFPKPLYCKVIQLQHSYIVFQLKSIIRCETSFSHIWYQDVHPGVQAMLPLTTMDIKALCVLYERAGFSFTRIIKNIIRVSEHSPCISLSTLQKLSFLFNIISYYYYYYYYYYYHYYYYHYHCYSYSLSLF